MTASGESKRTNGSEAQIGERCVLLDLPGIVHRANLIFGRAERLDALYVPTHRLHSISLTRLQKLRAHCKNIYILATRHAKQVFSKRGRIPSGCKMLDAGTDKAFVASFKSLGTFNNPSSQVTRSYDLPLKRNFALRHARGNGHQFIGLIDDDIEVDSLHVAKATKCVRDGASMAGYCAFDYPDVSTIDHVDRILTGDESFTMVGGNALFMNTGRVSGFFPYVYNEDWMFVLHNLEVQQMISLGDVHQRAGEPWRNLKRIRFEEFGETVIEGFLALKWNDASIYSGTRQFWSEVLRRRRHYLSELRERCRSPIFGTALTTALSQNATFTGRQLTLFVSALERDMRNFLA